MARDVLTVPENREMTSEHTSQDVTFTLLLRCCVDHTMAPYLQKLCLALLGVLLPHDNARAWSFLMGGGCIQYRSRAPSSNSRHLHEVMMAKDGDLVRVSLPKPLGIQLEEIAPGAPGVRVVGVVEGGTAKENGVSGNLKLTHMRCSVYHMM